MPEPQLAQDGKLLSQYSDHIVRLTDGEAYGSLGNELAWLQSGRDKLSTRLEGTPPWMDDANVPFEHSYLNAFSKQRDLELAWYDKTMKLYQEDPSDENRTNLLNGMRMFHSIPLESMLPEFNPQNGQKNYYLNLPSHYSQLSADSEGEAGRRHRFGFNPDAVPTTNLKGESENIQINSQNTRFWNNRGDFVEGFGIYEDIFRQQKYLSDEELAAVYNNLLRSADNADSIGKPLVNGHYDIPRKPENILIGKIGAPQEEGDDDPNVPTKLWDLEDPIGALESMRDPSKGSVNADKRPLSVIDVEMYNAITSRKPFEQMLQESEEESWNETWKEQNLVFANPDLVTNTTTRKWLIDQIAQMKYEALGDEDRQQLQDLLGVIGREGMTKLSRNVPTRSSNGRGFINFTGGTHNIDDRAKRAIELFKINQLNLINEAEPDGWNSGFKAMEVEKGGERKIEAYDRHIAVKTDMLMRVLQRMKTGAGEEWPRPAGEGKSFDDLGLLDDATDEQILEASNILKDASTIATVAVGMQGGTRSDMDLAVDIVAQILQAINEAALRGEDTEKFRHRAEKDYVDDQGNKRMYDFRQSAGADEVHDNFGPFWMFTQSDNLYEEKGYSATGATGGPRQDPVYQLFANFMQEAEQYVILEGLRGNRVTPVLEYFGLSTSSDDKKQLPLRISKIRLRGTDIEASRFMKKNLEGGFFFKHPFLTKAFSGTSRTREPVDEAKASSDLRARKEIDLENKETTKIEAVDKGTLGVMRKGYSSWKDTNNDGVVDAKENLVKDQRVRKKNPKRRK